MCTHLRPLFPPANVTSWAFLPGRWEWEVFFVMRVTPPFSPLAGITPTAYPIDQHPVYDNNYPFRIPSVLYFGDVAYSVVDETGVLFHKLAKHSPFES
jgi:hypothetical protein